MTLPDGSFAELAQSLKEEASEQVERVGSALLEIEKGVDSNRLESLLEDSMRQAHNLKGTASSLGFGLAAKLAHAIESLLSQVRLLDPATAKQAFDLLHQGLSAVPRAIEVAPGVDSDPAVNPVIDRLEGYRPSARSAHAEPPPTTVVAPPSKHERETEPPARGDPRPAAHVPPPLPAAPRVRSAARADVAPAAGPGPEHGRAVLAEHVTIVGTGSTGRAYTATGVRGGSETSARLAEESLRVSMRKLNALMAQVGELLAARLRTDQRLAELRSLLAAEEERSDRQASLRASLRDRATPCGDPFTQSLVEAIGDGADRQKLLVRRLRELVRAFETDAMQSTILSGELQEDIRRIQTFPLASVLDPLPRAVRNMAREVGKDAELVVEGAELELDKKVLEALRDPLNHLLRNAVDHGLESPAQRARDRKPPRGTLWIRAKHRGDSIVISVADDGQGVDVEAVLQRARERGLADPGETADTVGEQRLLDLLCLPGFTTREHATGMSGRGVGLDSVRANIEDLQGSLSIETRRALGTTMTIVLPLTIYVVRALVMRVGTHELAMPISSITRILRVSPEAVLDVEGSEAVVIDGRPTALIALATLLGIAADPRREGDRISVVVVGAGQTRCALAVDEIVGDQTVLAKKLEPPLVRLRNIAGATIRGDGSVLLMLNPLELMRAASARTVVGAQLGRRAAAPPARPRLLLADDSFTTRALERSVLELAGFDVVAVADGQEALEALQSPARFAAIVSDVTMPRVSGFELCTKVRADERLRALPIVLVTSLGSDADRRRGMEVGADAYVVKSEFDHEKLVAKVNELIGRR